MRRTLTGNTLRDAEVSLLHMVQKSNFTTWIPSLTFVLRRLVLKLKKHAIK